MIIPHVLFFLHHQCSCSSSHYSSALVQVININSKIHTSQSNNGDYSPPPRVIILFFSTNLIRLPMALRTNLKALMWPIKLCIIPHSSLSFSPLSLVITVHLFSYLECDRFCTSGPLRRFLCLQYICDPKFSLTCLVASKLQILACMQLLLYRLSLTFQSELGSSVTYSPKYLLLAQGM